jgi:hypothetical protein
VPAFHDGRFIIGVDEAGLPILTNPPDPARGALLGYTSAGDPVYESDGEAAASLVAFPAQTDAPATGATTTVSGGVPDSSQLIARGGGVAQQLRLGSRQMDAQGACGGVPGAVGMGGGSVFGRIGMVDGTGVPYGERVTFGDSGSTPPLTPPTPNCGSGLTPPLPWMHGQGQPWGQSGPGTAEGSVARQPPSLGVGISVSGLPGGAAAGRGVGMHAAHVPGGKPAGAFGGSLHGAAMVRFLPRVKCSFYFQASAWRGQGSDGSPAADSQWRGIHLRAAW